MQTSAAHKSGALFTHLALVTKYVVGEIHRDSDSMAERSATVTRRVQPARGKGFCEAETLMPITAPNLKIGRLVGEDLRRDFVEAIEGNSADVRWSQIRGTHFALVAHKEGGQRDRLYWTGTRSPNGVMPWKAVVETSAGHKSGALFTHLP